jgi:hypothetical protein
MKRFFAALAIVALVGCAHTGSTQVPPGPQTYTCPPATVNGTAYAPLNPASNAQNPPTASLSYSDSPGVGVFCYIVQSWVSPNSSVPSNVAQVNVTGTTPPVSVTWQAPQGASGYTYIVSRAPAVANSPLLVPTLNAATFAAAIPENPLLPAPTVTFALLSNAKAKR